MIFFFLLFIFPIFEIHIVDLKKIMSLKLIEKYESYSLILQCVKVP